MAIWDVALTRFFRSVLWLVAIQALPGQQTRVEVSGSTPAARAAVESVRVRAERGLDRLQPMFAPQRTGPIRIFVHATADDIPAHLRSALHPGTAGFALRGRDEVHLILDASRRQPPDDLATVVDHELVHVLLDRHVGAAAGPFVSRWFHEGLAQVLSSGVYLGASEETIVFRLLSNTLQTFTELHLDFPHGDRLALPVAYAQSFSFVMYLRREVGLPTLLAAARRSRSGSTYADAFYAETGRPLGELEQAWRHYLRTGSGAGLRFLQDNCFGLALSLALPLLVLAGMKAWRRDQRRAQSLERKEAAELEAGIDADGDSYIDPDVHPDVDLDVDLDDETRDAPPTDPRP